MVEHPESDKSRNIQVAHGKVTIKGNLLDAKVFLHIATSSVHSEFMGWRCVLSSTRHDIYCKTLIDVLIMLQSQEILFVSSRILNGTGSARLKKGTQALNTQHSLIIISQQLCVKMQTAELLELFH